MPDDPENEFLFLFNGLMNAFEMIKFTLIKPLQCIDYASTRNVSPTSTRRFRKDSPSISRE
jgi:hypothetical protein